MKLLLQLRETLDLIASLFRREFELWFQFDAAQNRFFVTGGEPRRLRPVVARFGWFPFPQDRFGRLPRLALLLLSRRTRVLLDGLDNFDLDPATDRLGLLWIFAEDEIRNSGVGIGNRDELVGDDLAVATAAVVVVVQMLGPEVLVQHPQFSEHLENQSRSKAQISHMFLTM